MRMRGECKIDTSKPRNKARRPYLVYVVLGVIIIFILLDLARSKLRMLSGMCELGFVRCKQAINQTRLVPLIPYGARFALTVTVGVADVVVSGVVEKRVEDDAEEMVNKACTLLLPHVEVEFEFEILVRHHVYIHDTIIHHGDPLPHSHSFGHRGLQLLIGWEIQTAGNEQSRFLEILHPCDRVLDMLLKRIEEASESNAHQCNPLSIGLFDGINHMCVLQESRIVGGHAIRSQVYNVGPFCLCRIYGQA